MQAYLLSLQRFAGYGGLDVELHAVFMPPVSDKSAGVQKITSRILLINNDIAINCLKMEKNCLFFLKS
jgi:hypothetical protein